MHTGKEVRLQKLWKHKRTVLIPYDHGSYSGPAKGIEDPLALTERIARTKADGILVTPGVLKRIAPAVGDLGVMLRIDGGFTKYVTGQTDYQSFYAIPDALKLGADAAIVFTFINTDSDVESMRRLGAAAAEADAWGMPLAAEILPPSLLNNHFATNIFRTPDTAADVVQETMIVTRIGAEAGADIVKTRYCGNVDDFRRVVQSCGARVIVAGGPMSNSTDEQLLQLTRDCIDAGAHGIIFGRNVWQHPKMEMLIDALCAIVHDDETVAGALKLLR